MTDTSEKPVEEQPELSSGASELRKYKAKKFAASVAAGTGTEGDRVGLVQRPMEVPEGRPNSRRFVRFHPEMEFQVYVFEDPNVDDEDDLPTKYLVTPEVARNMDPDDVRRATLYVYVYRSSRPRPSLWLVPDPKLGNSKSEDWHDAKIEIIGHAREEWTRIKRSPDRKVSSYEPIHPLSAVYADPDWDRILQGREIEELVQLAFGKDVIDSMDHPAIVDFLGLSDGA